MLYNCGFSETRELYFFTFRFFLNFCDIGFFAINISADIHQTATILKTSVFLNDKKRRLLKTISLSQLYSCLSQKTSVYHHSDFDTNLLNIRSAKYLDSLRYIQSTIIKYPKIEILLRLDYMPLHYISLNLFSKCLYFQSIFILYYGSPKI